MSTYDSGRTRAMAAATNAICARLNIDEEALVELPALASMLTPLLTASNPQLVHDGLAVLPATARAALEQLAPAEMRAVDGALLGDRPRRAVKGLLAAVDKAAVQLAGARRDVTIDAVTSFAKDPAADFDKVRVARGSSVTAVELRKGESRLMVRVHDDGRVEREYSGLVENTCVDVDKAFVAHLVCAGILLESEERDVHGGRRDGARLVKPAEAEDPENPARGSVRRAQRAARERHRVFEEVQAARQRRLA